MMRGKPIQALILAGSMFAASCGSDSGSSSDDGLLFHGEGKLLDGFKFNTGPQPPSGPASVTLRLSGSGVVAVDARGSVDSGKLAPRAGTGSVKIDAHVTLDGTLKVDSPIKKSTGDIPGLKDIDIAIAGTASFDPFLLEGGTADVVADVPETKLPDIPLGSVPGKLKLTVVSGSRLTSKFHATCMTVASGEAQYEGDAETSGTLVLKGVIALELPAPLNKEIALPEIKVPIPSAHSKVEFAKVATSGAADETTGACSTSSGGDAGIDSSPPSDTSSDPDTGVIITDSGVSDTAPPTDTGPTICSGDGHEPDDTKSQAYVLAGINDCDGSGKTVSGMLSSSSDVDVLRFDGEDTFGCSVNAYAKVASGPIRLCLEATCTGGTTDFKGCAKGTVSGTSCCGSEVEADFNCNGTTKDSARVSITVRPNGSIASCSNYSLQYHF